MSAAFQSETDTSLSMVMNTDNVALTQKPKNSASARLIRKPYILCRQQSASTDLILACDMQQRHSAARQHESLTPASC